ncbi:MAG TPA: hypothetical protein VFQ76_02150 [Longimicrobiaceae bacterium]|nr:hypothetical protein [Longimicrobiaceae bacterium]
MMDMNHPPFRSKKHQMEPWPFGWLIKRRRIKTVIARLVERFHLAHVWREEQR